MEIVGFLVWVRLGGAGWACKPSLGSVAGTNLQCGRAVDQRPMQSNSFIYIDSAFGKDHG